MKLKVQRMATAVCGLALGTEIAQAKTFSPLGIIEKVGPLGQSEVVPEHGGIGVFTAVGVAAILTVMFFRKVLRRQSN